MDTEYDRKFEEMKKYIPFLETMIQRLESSGSRHAQLSKIKALRDLLLDKSKRMKMDNLLKCEQVLVNLYAKVEQRDSLPGLKSSNRPTVESLDSARQKLKVISNKSGNEDDRDTLPEIARANQVEVVCSPGSKEPALFQRRPNKTSPAKSPIPDKTQQKRNYTRVLVSPEPGTSRSDSETREREKRMFQRRSPKKSPLKSHKGKSRRESDKSSKKTKDLNILLKVPQKSLQALNTDNIGERIMNCDDTDVDISTLRELRSQILSELKKTGTNEDISDLIMKSYGKKGKKKAVAANKEADVEEGEISDSESEAIDHIYGNLVVVNDKKGDQDKDCDKVQPEKTVDSRKIQICFVVADGDKKPLQKVNAFKADGGEIIELDNSDDTNETIVPNPNEFNLASKAESLAKSKKGSEEPALTKDLLKDDGGCNEPDKNHKSLCLAESSSSQNVTSPIKPTSPKSTISHQKIANSPQSSTISTNSSMQTTALDILNITKNKTHINLPVAPEPPRKANFYKPLVEINDMQTKIEKDKNVENIDNKAKSGNSTQESLSEKNDFCPKDQSDVEPNKETLPISKPIKATEKVTALKSPESASKLQKDEAISSPQNKVENKTRPSSDIPFLSDVPEKEEVPKETVFSQIEILQALKNDILGDSLKLPIMDTSAIHQPKLTKVTNAQEIVRNKITLDKYKEKALSSRRSTRKVSDEVSIGQQKQSRGLTEKECERFNLPCRLSLDNDYSSDEGPEKRSSPLSDIIYSDLAPQSPDAQANASTLSTTPVIIPAEPLKPPVAASKSDIDMRSLTMTYSEAVQKKSDNAKEVYKSKSDICAIRPNDPRLRKDVSVKPQTNISNSDGASLPVPPPFPASPFPNATPIRTPNSRTFEMGTPSHQTFDLSDSNRPRKHVYAPSFTSFDTNDGREGSVAKDNRSSDWDRSDKNDRNRNINNQEEDLRYGGRSSHRDQYDRSSRPSYDRNSNRADFPTTPVHPFGRSDGSVTPSPSFGRSDGPRTPLPSFGRSEGPMTPLPSFGRSDGSRTPLPSFGRSDAPMTPLPSFGRSECPTTPIHQFGRSEMPRTPSHPFGRSDYHPSTPHPFGRSEYQRPSAHTYERPYDTRYKRGGYDNVSKERNTYHYNQNAYENEKYSDNHKYGEKDFYAQRYSHRGVSCERNDGRKDEFHSYDYNRRIERNFDDRNHFNEYRNQPRDTRYVYDTNKQRHDSRRQQYDRERNERGQLESSSGRTIYRAPSHSRYEEKLPDRTVSVEAHAGRSFTIDTSVNATFQSFDKGVLNKTTFDARRQRAASVGRSFVRENSVEAQVFTERTLRRTFVRGSSVGRSNNIDDQNSCHQGRGRALAEAFVPQFNKHFYTNKPVNRFGRAQSVGRDVVGKSFKSFAETKAEFKSYKAPTYDKRKKERKSIEFQKNVSSSIQREHLRDKDSHQQRNRPAIDKNEPYSPRKNLRDPRMHKSYKDKYHIDHRTSRNPRDKLYGIVYTNDNIAKGNVIGPGYGVKNYKIPKIKRPQEETTSQDSDSSKSESIKSSSNEKSKNKDCDNQKETSSKKAITHKNDRVTTKENEKAKKKTKQSESVKFVSKSVKSNEAKSSPAKIKDQKQIKESVGESDDSSDGIRPKKQRSTRRNIVYDSESEKEEENTTKSPIVKLKNTEITKATANNLADLDLDFGDDDHLDVFTDNITSDDVIENINDLIADLDKDIGNKMDGDLVTHITKDDVFDSLFENLENMKNPDFPKAENERSVEKFQSQNEPIIANDNKNTMSQKSPTKALYKMLQSPPASITTSPLKTGSPKKLNLQRSPKPQVVCPPNHASCEPKIIPASPKNIDVADISLSANTADPSLQIDNVSDETKQEEINKQKQEAAPVFIPNVPDSVVSTSAESESNKNYATEIPGTNSAINSTPDSTIENDESNQGSEVGKAAESASILETENMNPDITSTHDSNDLSAKACSSVSNTENKDMNSINSILSLLQDKTRIQELISLIGNQQEGDKLKKKLEKLSEIVYDDEDDKGVGDNIPETDPKKHEESLPKFVESQPLENVDNNLKNSDASSKTVDDDKDNDSIRKTQADTIESVRKIKRRGKGIKKAKKKLQKQTIKRVTRSGAAQKPKRANELKKLQDDIRDMFISNDILNATGIRMCRLAKLSDETVNTAEQDNEVNKNKTKAGPKKDESNAHANKPMVVIEKMNIKEPELTKPPRKKPGPKPKPKPPPRAIEEIKKPERRKPGPKSKTKLQEPSDDPYIFESDSMSEATTKTSETSPANSSSESEDDESLASSTTSVGSTELLSELKAKKRRRGCWQSGVIRRPKKKTMHLNAEKLKEIDLAANKPSEEKCLHKIPDYNCFTDVRYCFKKNTSSYPCRLCNYKGENIVSHYKNNHPHYEIPLSRMMQNVAKEAIKQSMVTNFQKISKAPLNKYVCRFCNITFDDKRKLLLETFFWHIVSCHTGEYKHLCSECLNTTSCTFMLDIPPPPKNTQGLLMGYVCGKCFYTQVSLENLKNHVSLRHNDEETEVYTISLSIITQHMVEAMEKMVIEESPRVLRNSKQFAPSNSRENSDNEESLENLSRPLSVQSKISFENEDCSYVVKSETRGYEDNTADKMQDSDSDHVPDEFMPPANAITNDIFNHAHLKVNISKTGAKEYICAATGGDNHYKTTLLISLKQHVLKSHSTETWDGYCFFCKVIVMPQGKHSYKDCLLHFLDKHLEDGIVPADIESNETSETPTEKEPESAPLATVPPKPYINVRPISELLSTPVTAAATEQDDVLPKIQSVVSLNTEAFVDQRPIAMPLPHEKLVIHIEQIPTEPLKKPEIEYEESLKKTMAHKYRIALDTMSTNEKLAHLFKCPSRYCSFTCDSPEDALYHVSTHVRMGCADAMKCCYCSFDCSGNSIDFVSHIFKDHGNCKYCCKYCFYRARTLAMIEAHHQEAHKQQSGPKIAIMIPTLLGSGTQTALLTRKDAVKCYLCVHGRGTSNECNFKTATPDTFCKHLANDHSNVTSHRCSECEESFVYPTLLVEHLSKKHEIKSFQCSWCVFGAETRIQILTHCANKHPTEMPQAYWRKIMPSEEGKPPKVLPLVSLSGSTTFTVVEPNLNQQKCDPVREAERANDLEKLVSVTTQLSDISAANQENSTELPDDADDLPTQEEPLELPTEEEGNRFLNEPAQTEATPTETSVADRATPVLKKEPIDETDVKPTTLMHIISLDSDEEDANQPADDVIELSDSDHEGNTSDKAKKRGPIIRADDLYSCDKCKNIYKNAQGFKRHIAYCYGYSEQIRCAHCSEGFLCSRTLEKHLKLAHGPQEKHMCGVCNFTDPKPTTLKNHMSTAHGIMKFVIRVNTSADGFTVTNTFEGESALAQAAKRSRPKRSLTKEQPTTSKQKRFSPDDISSLPITPIFEESTHCALCEFNTKVRINMVRHLQAHAQKQPDLPEIAPVNPVPHLETNKMHFDRMVNLASSSITSRATEQSNRSDQVPTIALHVPLEIAARYPKYVPERKRYACGARNCTYISIDEAMLNIHWETLHSGSNDYHCVHCPANQHLDTSRALTAGRIIAHLKMHDMRLYCCSECTYYHHLKHLIEKHINEKHNGGGHVKIVREPLTGPVATTSSQPGAGSMDLKPWHCGLCKFSDMLRPKVVEHCSRYHNSKFQYKCLFCPWRSSAIENVVKHHMFTHKQNETGVFYFYYQEGSLPEVGGKPVWIVQKEKTKTPEVKEDPEPVPETPPPTVDVDMDIVKKEPVENSDVRAEVLPHEFPEFCDPNGLLYKCPFCKVATERDKIGMQSHLYEELKYRRWACNICSYKAFHTQGLKDHAAHEHKGSMIKATELPANTEIESWVAKILQHQDRKIEENRASLKNVATPMSTAVVQQEVSKQGSSYSTQEQGTGDFTNEELEKAFGSFGVPTNSMLFSCPKCDFTTKDEAKMSEHLEMELSKVRWCCSECSDKYTQYHQAQLHCRTAHTCARPIEALRDPAARRAWPRALLAVQKLSMNLLPYAPASNPDPEPETPNNDLLVVRYEKTIPPPDTTPSFPLENVTVTSGPPTKRKRPVSYDRDSEEDQLIIDETPSKKPNLTSKPVTCPHCYFQSAHKNFMRIHILRHYNMKPFSCPHCEFDGNRNNVKEHIENVHPGLGKNVQRTVVPSVPPPNIYPLDEDILKVKTPQQISEATHPIAPKTCESGKPTRIESVQPLPNTDTETKTQETSPSNSKEKMFICLTCEQEVSETATRSHVHPNEGPQYAKKGDLILKCTSCSVCKNNLPAMKQHHIEIHPLKKLDYVYTRLNVETTGPLICKFKACSSSFVYMDDLKKHFIEKHKRSPIEFTITPNYNQQTEAMTEIDTSLTSVPIGEKRKLGDEQTPTSSIAKKSTTKLPYKSIIAKKSTTKLPMLYVEESETDDEGYSYYGTKPKSLDQYSNVTTHMPTQDNVVPFSVNKLKDIVDIAPKIVVKKIPDQ